MDKVPDLNQGRHMHLLVNSRGGFIRDTKANRWWIAAVLLFALGAALLSAGLFLLVEFGTNNKISTYWDALYFTAINMTTVGFGDIAPISSWGRAIAVVNALVGLVLFGLLVAVIALALQGRESAGAVAGTFIMMEGGDGDRPADGPGRGSQKSPDLAPLDGERPAEKDDAYTARERQLLRDIAEMLRELTIMREQRLLQDFIRAGKESKRGTL